MKEGVTSIPKPLKWVGSSREDLKEMPEDVQDDVGFALYLAQLGLKHRRAKPLSGFGGAGVLEVVENHEGDTYRVVYVVRFAEMVFVLHAFQKKSKEGKKTPKHESKKIADRLKRAETEYAQWRKEHETEKKQAN